MHPWPMPRARVPEDRFSLTPQGLYDDLARIAQQSLSSWGDDRRRRETRLRGELGEDEKGKEEAQRTVAGVDEPLRPKDKYGLVLPLAV